jgi:UDP-2,4-diacetamido-2,4,6-trideoxy-beta-L-altropyranose hydrolase
MDLFIRVDANRQIGTGHLMRCLSLGQAWKRAGGKVCFITTCSNDRLLQRLVCEGFAVHQLNDSYPNVQDWRVTEEVLAQNPGAWLILDGYYFDSTYQRQVKQAGYRLMTLDDTAHLPYYYADIVLNQNIQSEELCYSCEPYTKLLLGTQYALLRQEFLKWKGWKREFPEDAQKVLVTMGGSDPDNVSLRVIQALKRIDAPMEVSVVVGPTNPHLESIQNELSLTPFAFELLSSVENMPDLMARADVALCAGGSTCWELAFMGLPGLIFVLAENQARVARVLKKREVFLSFEERCHPAIKDIAKTLIKLIQNASLRQKLSRNGRFLVDGLGSDRVVKALAEG